MLRKIAAGLVVLGALPSAQAALYDFGPHDFAEFSFAVGAGYAPTGAFQDFLTFTLGAPVNVTSTVVALNQDGLLGLTGGFYYIYAAGTNGQFGDGDDFIVPATTHSFDGTTGSTSHSAVLGAGAYAYVVQGTATNFGGYYSMASSVSAVPEVETYSLLLAGLGLLALRSRRRND
jgi:MYXO-CTERM domain-containing protein